MDLRTATTEAPYTLRMATSGAYQYIGQAEPGASEGDAVWRIQRLTTADNTILWADGNERFDNVWTDRASLSYS